MKYDEILKYMEEISAKGSIMGLDSTKCLMKKLGNPEKELKAVHFAGTNGKGSTVAFTESILLSAGYRVAKYTTPAVFEYLEMFRINGENISEDDYTHYMNVIIEKCKEMEEEGMGHPTAFEMETALAFLYFSEKTPDIVLLETGMGGLTDATNILESVLCSVITTVGLDHMAFLGETLAEITAVKAGIIKKACPVVTYEQEDEIMKVIKETCREKNSKLYIADIMERNLLADGVYQHINSSIATKTAMVLRKCGYKISDENIEDGIKSMTIPGRFERICEEPLIIIDGAHNPCAAIQLRKTIDLYFTNTKLVFIMGALVDKDYKSVAKTVLRKDDVVFTVSTKGKRKLEASLLAESIEDGSKVEATGSIKEALNRAIDEKNMTGAGAVIAFGSLSFLGELKKEVVEKCL